jgi:quercetin dioxygenase-like cupin family protein
MEWALALVIGIAIGAVGMHFRQAGRHPVQAAQLLHSDLTGVPGKEVFMTIIEVKPGAGVAAHLHNGDEFVYVLEGSYERFVEQAHTVASAGVAFSIEREKVHGALRRMVATTPEPGTNTLLVTHKPNILDAFGKDWFEVKEGEASVFRPSADGKTVLVARLQAADWVKGAK